MGTGPGREYGRGNRGSKDAHTVRLAGLLQARGRVEGKVPRLIGLPPATTITPTDSKRSPEGESF
jgi:hypothetical protein